MQSLALGRPKPLAAVRDVQCQAKRRHCIHIPVLEVKELVNM